jgi:hypothetical protein
MHAETRAIPAYAPPLSTRSRGAAGESGRKVINGLGLKSTSVEDSDVHLRRDDRVPRICNEQGGFLADLRDRSQGAIVSGMERRPVR